MEGVSTKSQATLPNGKKKVRVTMSLISKCAVKKINTAKDRQ